MSLQSVCIQVVQQVSCCRIQKLQVAFCSCQQHEYVTICIVYKLHELNTYQKLVYLGLVLSLPLCQAFEGSCGLSEAKG